MQHRSRHGCFRNFNRRQLRAESLEPRHLFASDMGCSPDWGLTGASDSRFDGDPVFGPTLDLAQLSHLDLLNGTILDSRGLQFAKLPPIERIALDEAENSGSGIPSRQGPEVPIFQSKPEATKKIFLDFDGELISGTFWNNQNYTGSYNTGAFIDAPAFSIDSDRTRFSAQEQTVIREVWARMAEDFAPFQVDVTTVYPGDAAIYQGNEAIRVMISTDVDATTGQQWFPPAGGVAYLNSWSFTNGTPVWVFFNRLGTSNAKNIAEAGSHEVGHAFGLLHDGRTNPREDYYRGHGSGQTGWAPIMGVGYDKALVQWSRGEYANANQRQDDLAIISGLVSYEVDDHGDTSNTATPLTVGETGGMTVNGLITTRDDRDAFQFFTQTGTVTLRVDPFELATGKANLDAELSIFDSSGNLVASANPASTLDASISLNLAKGTYIAIVDGVGKASSPEEQGYSDYASLGRYTLNGTVIRNRPPEIGLGSTTVISNEGETLTNQGTWSDPNPEDSVTFSASIGTIEQESNGTWKWSLSTQDQLPQTEVVVTAIDDSGLATTVSFMVSAVNQPPRLTASQTSVSGTVLSLLTNTGTWNDVSSDTVTLSTSHGSIEKKSDGTWIWEFRPSETLNSLVVTLTGTDEDGGSSQVQFTVDALAAVVNSRIYYKGSSFSGTGIDAALDPEKTLVQSNTSPQRLGFANLINTTRGINGLVFDVAGLISANLTQSDFQFRMSPQGLFNEATNPPKDWELAPAPSLIDVVLGTAELPARVRLEWIDGAIANRWLQIKILNSSNTGLIAPHVFYVGHLLGETTGSDEGGAFRVRGTDVSPIVAQINPALPVPVSSIYDINKDGRIRGTDTSPVVAAVGALLRIITIPVFGSGDEGEGHSDRGRLSDAASPRSSKTPEEVNLDVHRARTIQARKAAREFAVHLPSHKPDAALDFPTSPEWLHSKAPEHRVLSLDQYFELIARDDDRELMES